MKALTTLFSLMLVLSFSSCTHEIAAPLSCDDQLTEFVQRISGKRLKGNGTYTDRTFAQDRANGFACEQSQTAMGLEFLKEPNAGYGEWWETKANAQDQFWMISYYPAENQVEFRLCTWWRENGVLTPGYHVDQEKVWDVE